MSFKSGFVSIVGRPNVGKSTLLNQILKTKLAIMSDVAQTTRNTIQGIYTDNEAQIIFMDTPGIHKPKTKLGETMLETAYGAVGDVDVILFLVDCTKQEITKGDRIILEKIKQAKELLQYSNYRIQEISEYLSFSNQSSFTKCFKLETGMTPKEFRKSCFKQTR